MLRTLGSSLIAKAGVGSRTRELAESAIQNPQFPEKGQPGTVARELVQDPLERPVPPGSDKVIAQQPLIESAALEPPTSPVEPNVTPPSSPDIGIGISGNRANPSVPAGAANQPLFQGGVSPAAPASRAPQGVGGKVASTTGGQAQVAKAYEPTPSPNVEAMGLTPDFERTSAGSALGNLLGTKAYAGEPSRSVPYTPTTGQYLSGAAGKVASAVGNVINSPQLRSLGANLQSAGGQPTKSATGQPVSQPGSVSSGLRSLVQTVQNTVQKAVQSVNSLLRSFKLF